MADRICSVSECGRRHWAKGFCRFHWQRQYDGVPFDRPFGAHTDTQSWINKEYRWRRVNGRDVLEHRYIVEQQIGRLLAVDECVHHKDGNKLNNDLANLEIVPRDRHTSLHRLHRQLCRICGRDDPHQSRGVCAACRSRELTRTHYAGAARQTRTCTVCGGEYTVPVNYPKTKTCSPSCQMQSYALARWRLKHENIVRAFT